MNHPLPPPIIGSPPIVSGNRNWSDSGFYGSVSFLASMILHATILVGLAVFAVTEGGNNSFMILASTSSELPVNLTQLQIVETNIYDASEQALEQETIDSPSLDKLFSDSALNQDSVEFVLPAPQLASMDGMTQDTLRQASTTFANVPSKTPTISKLESGASYYGIRASGRRFVYVVDASTSMTGMRWEHALKELLDSLSGLPRDAEYYVIFFSDETQLMYEHNENTCAFQPAGIDSVRQTRQWVSQIYLGPSTRPMRAIRIALQMRPDAVFLLSDGEFRDGTRNWIATLTGRRQNSEIPVCPIHTIGLYSNAGLGTLEYVANRTGGSFRLVRAPF